MPDAVELARAGEGSRHRRRHLEAQLREAKEAMFLHTDTSDAPWTVIKSDCKKRARLNAMRFVLSRIPYTKRDPGRIGAVDPLIVGRPGLAIGGGDDQLAIATRL